MPTTVDQRFETTKVLGSGFSATTKLASDVTTGEQVALKIFDLSKGDINKKELDLLANEFENCKDFDHQHIVKYHACNFNTQEVKENGSAKTVAYIAMEPVMGVELFDYVANTGPFEGKFARHYFKQMLMGLHYLHSNGNAHRDLKPENIMLDKDYSVKIIDFGFTCNIAGRNGTGTNSSGVGTPGYMAPEILLKQPYQANAVDLFALGVILFIIYAGHPPFNLAKDDDSHYRLLASQRADLFWKAHSNSKAKDFFTEEFKDLITAMLQLQPHMRLCMSDIIGHPWMQQEYPTADEIAEEFGRRHAINKQKAGAEESRKASMAENVNDRRARRGAAGNNQAIYCDADDVPADLKENTNLKTLALGKYTESDAKHINFFSMFDATELMTQITNYLATQKQDFKISEKSFKVTLEAKRQVNTTAAVPDDDDGNDEESKQEDPIYETCRLAIRLLKVNDGKICVDFQRKTGSAIHFYDVIGSLKNDLRLCNNTTLEDGTTA